MRTIIDLPEELIAQLDALRAAERVSRAEIIRRAIRLYLKHVGHPDRTRLEAAFGLWKARKIDSLAYEDAVRREWEAP